MTYSIPRRDVKGLAKRLLRQWGSLEAVLRADAHALHGRGRATARQTMEKRQEASSNPPPAPQKDDTTDGFVSLGEGSVVLMKLVEELQRRTARQAISDKDTVFENWEQILNYVQIRYKGVNREHLHILYLDGGHRLIMDEVQGRGTVDATPIYTREVIQRALELGAVSLVIVHNHPSGNPTPSPEDCARTLEIRDAGIQVGIDLHDHLIVGRGGDVVSFKESGYL